MTTTSDTNIVSTMIRNYSRPDTGSTFRDSIDALDQLKKIAAIANNISWSALQGNFPNSEELLQGIKTIVTEIRYNVFIIMGMTEDDYKMCGGHNGDSYDFYTFGMDFYLNSANILEHRVKMLQM